VQGLTERVAELLHELTNLPAFASLSTAQAVPAGSPWIFSNYIFWMLIAALLTAVFFMIAARKVRLVPAGISNIAEVGIEFVRTMCDDVIGERGVDYFPFVATLFFFILFNNMLGLIPGFKPGTGTIGVPATLAIMTWFVFVWVGIRKNGFFGYLKSLIPSDVRRMGIASRIGLGAYIFVLEFFSTFFIRPLTLAIRLFANMYAGHIIIGIFSAFVALSWAKFSVGGGFIGAVSLVMTIVMYAFEIFVAFIQAYVFAILTAAYIGTSVHAAEH
jgi:F-type H+-transporting ATPase subunit a